MIIESQFYYNQNPDLQAKVLTGSYIGDFSFNDRAQNENHPLKEEKRIS